MRPLASNSSSTEAITRDSNPDSAPSSRPESKITIARQKPRQSSWKYVLKTWKKELLCCFLVVGSLLGLAATIAFHQRRPLPEWPYSLTINSVISIFILVFKTGAAVILSEGLGQLKWSWFSRSRPLKDIATFDDASRGPWGAAKLLWVLKHRQLAASLAAFIIVVGLALDPLAQQLVRYYDCQQPVPLLQRAFPSTQMYTETGIHTGAGQATTPNGVVAAVQAGIYASNALPIQWQCPTGNCTASQPYSSLGWCSRCDEVSDQVQLRNHTMRSGNSTGSFWTATLPSDVYSRTGNYSPAIPLTMRTSINDDESGTIVEVVYLDSEYGEEEYNATYYSEYVCEGVTCPADRNSSSSWCCRGFGAARCYSFPCAREYNATINGGTLNEVELSHTKDFGFNSGYLNAVNLGCLSTSQRTKLQQFGYTTTPNVSWTPYNASINTLDGTTQSQSEDGFYLEYFPHNGTTIKWDYEDQDAIFKSATNDDTVLSIVPQHCMYQTYYVTITDIFQYLFVALNGTVSVAPEYLAGPDVMTKLYDMGQVSYQSVVELHANATGSLDRYIRQNGNASYSVPGMATMYTSSTCLHVRWPWLIFPAAFTALLLLFFFCMVIETTRGGGADSSETGDGGGNSRHQDFKSSPLPLLFHGFDEKTLAGLRGRGTSDEVKRLEKDAKSMRVRFARSERGWNFEEKLDVLDIAGGEEGSLIAEGPGMRHG